MGVTCEECSDPGVCCRAMPVGKEFPADMSRDRVQSHMAHGLDAFSGLANTEPMPMLRPLRIDRRFCKRGGHSPERVTWLWECENLTPEGRCGDYDNRPKMCHLFEPGKDLPCAEYTGGWKGFLRNSR